jgi:hypothetical protein
MLIGFLKTKKKKMDIECQVLEKIFELLKMVIGLRWLINQERTVKCEAEF